MTTDTMTIKEKKLKNLRKILWICFGGFSAPVILFLLPFSVLLTTGDTIGTINGIDIPIWPAILITMFLCIALIGGVCAVIYHIFKYRIDRRDDNLFP